MLKVDKDGLYVEYHEPDVIEGLRLTRAIRKAAFDDTICQEDLLILALENMEMLIDKISFKGVDKTFREILKVKEAELELIRLADWVIALLFPDPEKKSS